MPVEDENTRKPLTPELEELKEEATQLFNKTREEEQPLIEEKRRELAEKGELKADTPGKAARQEKRPEIVYEPGSEHKLAMRLMEYIHPHCYQMSGRLITVEKLKAKKSFGAFELAKGAAVLTAMEFDDLEALANREVIWWRTFTKSRKKEYVQIKAAAPVVKQLLYSRQDWNFAILTGITQCPIFRWNGSILDTQGYDKETGLYADFEPDEFGHIPEFPEKEDAQAALAILQEALCDFPFKTDVHKSVALAAMLTSVMRQSVRTAPLFAFSAPCPGTGKSTLADLISVMAIGQSAPAFNYKHDEKELSKSLFAMLMAGARVMLIDNISGTIRNDDLSTMLTQETKRDRILGESKHMDVSTSCLVMATGNNLEIIGELIRRTMYCVLDAKLERPHERKFTHENIQQWALAERGKLVTAALTILRAYHCANYPGAKDLTPLGSFEEWSKFARGALVWLGLPDPLESQRELEAADPIREANAAALAALYDCFENKAMTCNDIMSRITQPYDPDPEKTATLHQSLQLAISNPRGITARTLGNWLRQLNNRIINGYKLIQFGKYQGAANWKVIPPPKPESDC